jgi:hypothetical protein
MANVEFRIMPNGEEGRWYWEVIKDGREIVARDVTDTEPAACEQAHEAAQRAGLLHKPSDFFFVFKPLDYTKKGQRPGWRKRRDGDPTNTS